MDGIRPCSVIKLILLVFIFTPNLIYAQDNTVVKIPNSPEAAAFIEFGNSPISHFTGKPNVSLPITTINGKELQLPISLNYDAGGVRVQQIATSVGLGWNLMAGGVVTRNVAGRPDDYLDARPNYKPFYSHDTDQYSNTFDHSIFDNYKLVRDNDPLQGLFPEGDLNRYYKFLGKLGDGRYEGSPDNYSFSIGTLSGTIVINYDDNSAYCIENPALKITPHFLPGETNQINGWTIYDESGTKYLFTKIEQTRIWDNSDLETYRTYNSAWYITQIRSASSLDIIDFIYGATSEWSKPQFFGSNKSFHDTPYFQEHCPGDELKSPPLADYYISQFELVQIRLNDKARIKFYFDTPRQDLEGRDKLDQIEVLNLKGETINTFDLIQSYLGSGSSERDKRLMLDRVEIYGKDLQTSPQVYTYDYISGALPPRNSFNQDFWGYYNGKSNGSLIPYYYDLDKNNDNFQGANRAPNFDYSKRATLKKITYPTGGYTEYTYEPHMTNEVAWKQKSGVIKANINVPGGEDLNDPYNYGSCDDRFGINIKPRGIETTFFVPAASTYKLSLNTDGIVQEGRHFQFLGIYKSADLVDCTTINGQQICSLENYIDAEVCDFIHGGNPDLIPEYFVYTNLSENTQLERNLNLEAGNYTIIGLNTNDQLAMNIVIEGVEEVNHYQTGGLRIKRQKSFAEVGGQPIETKYHYGSSRSGKGTLHAQLSFEKEITSEGSVSDEGTGYVSHNYNCSQVIRSSNNLINSNYHVTYASVEEEKIGTSSSSGSAVYKFISSRENTRKPFIKTNINNGRLIETVQLNDNGNAVSKSKNVLSQQTALSGTVGLVVNPSNHQDNNSDRYVVQKKYLNPTNEEELVSHARPNSLSPCAWSNGYLKILISCSNNIATNPNYLAEIEVMKDNIEQRGVPRNEIVLVDYCSATLPSKYLTYPFYDVQHCVRNEYGKSKYYYPSRWSQLNQTIQSTFESGQEFKIVNTYNYDNLDHFQITSQEMENSQGKMQRTEFAYPHDLIVSGQATVMDDLVQQNKINVPVEKHIKVDGTLARSTKTTYSNIDNSGTILPIKFESSKSNNPFTVDMEILTYDDGNPVEALARNGIKTTYLWGYDESLMVASILNEDYSTVTTWLENNGYSNWKALDGSSLESAMNDLRVQFPSAQITSFVHNPQIGIVNQTDPNGNKTSYEYDDFNRLNIIKNNNGEIIKKYDYHFKSNSN